MSEIDTLNPNTHDANGEEEIFVGERALPRFDLRTSPDNVGFCNGQEVSQLDSEPFNQLGYEPVALTDSPLHETFHKENNPSLDSLKERDGKDTFRVVTDTEGKTWLQKTVNYVPERLDWVEAAASAREEVYASRLAEHIGYPVPETTTLFHDHKPWLAYAYIEDHIDASKSTHLLAPTFADQVNNPQALETRQLFNMLLNSGGDGNFQGVIDPKSKTYYAQDVNFNIKGPTTADSVQDVAFDLVMVQSKGLKSHGAWSPLSDEGKAYGLAMMEKAAKISNEEAQVIFAYGTGEFADPVKCARVLKTRALAISELINDGYFNPK